KDVTFTVNTLDNQTNFINRLTGLSEKFYTRLPSQLISGANQLNNRVTTTYEGQVTTAVTYQVTVPDNTQLYVSVPNITFSNENNESVQITVNGQTTNYTKDNAYSLFELDYFYQVLSIDITLLLTEYELVSFDH